VSVHRFRPVRLVVAGVILASAAAALALPALRGWWRWRESNGLVKAARIFNREGCAACHLPAQGVEIRNPGSRLGTVPSLWGGSVMMYAKSLPEVEAYVRSGHPPDRMPPADQLIRMPAFEKRLGAADIRRLARYVWAAGGMHVPDEGAVARGYDAAVKNGCFSCHGVAGSGGRRNPGSFKGYLPGWLGPDYAELVRSDGELDEWIRTGAVRRLESNRIAQFFMRRQVLRMPAFGPRLSSAELDDLKIFVKWQRVRTPDSI
jgi:mono/diheme cytochrome c family protein